MPRYTFLFRIFALLLLLIQQAYWILAQKRASVGKTFTASFYSIVYLFDKYFPLFISVLLFVQLCGLQILSVSGIPFPLQSVGLFCVIVGILITIVARRTLGTNWSHAADYQVKEKQQLVTVGIYKYVRHPIYAGNTISLIGGELVAQSYLFAVFLIIFIYDYILSKREEVLLLKQFGNKYRAYMHRTKMFIPFVF